MVRPVAVPQGIQPINRNQAYAIMDQIYRTLHEKCYCDYWANSTSKKGIRTIRIRLRMAHYTQTKYEKFTSQEQVNKLLAEVMPIIDQYPNCLRLYSHPSAYSFSDGGNPLYLWAYIQQGGVALKNTCIKIWYVSDKSRRPIPAIQGQN